MKIAFLGLGIMGSRMAAHLTGPDHQLTVWNRTAATAEAFAQRHGATVAASPVAAATAADLVITMVVDGDQVRELLLGPDGAARAPGSRTFVDCSTIGPRAAVAIAGDLGRQGHRFLDAPVTGSSPRAEAGTLTFMVGGDPADVATVHPVLERMGSLIVHAGPVGQGQVVKVINNALAAINAAALGQALLVGAAAGADLDALVAVARAGSGGSVMLELKAEPMRTHDYRPLFKLDHMLKDVRLCLDQAAAAGVAFPFGSDVADLLSEASAMGFGEADFAALIEALESRSDLRL
jgi:3-hydroxyisobutyrate dehydrogenase-like beta-hydroxyacid dehydrogenase